MKASLEHTVGTQEVKGAGVGVTWTIQMRQQHGNSVISRIARIAVVQGLKRRTTEGFKPQLDLAGHVFRG